MFMIRLILTPLKWLLGLVALVAISIGVRRILIVVVPVFGLAALVGLNSCQQSDVVGLQSPVANAVALAASDANGKITIDASDPQQHRLLHDELFGVNSKWLDNGGGIIEYGEMIKDRSFRNQSTEGLQKWLEFEEPGINGVISHVQDSPAHGGTLAGKSYQGHLNISQDADGYTCITQLVLGNSKANQKYQLNVSARRVAGGPVLSAFFANYDFLAIEEPDNLTRISSGDWQDYSFILEPGEDVEPGILRICNVAAGSIDLDEVRLRQVGSDPRVSSKADARIKELGVRSIRWPSGTDADRFFWKESIGPLGSRGENIDTFGNYQTPSWGLHEFLNYCDANNLVPLITVNVTDSPQNSADLVEYILGSTDTPMGQLRATNGRTSPWDVVHFELGNEPNEAYQGSYDYDDISLGYLDYSKATAAAMLETSDRLGVRIELKGTVESTFTVADWIEAVPMLADWNANVLDPTTGMLPYIEQIKGNFYAGFTSAFFKENLYNEIMAGGATLAATVNALNELTDRDMPFWLTEYSLMVQKSNPTRIEVDRLKDYQAGMSVADLLMTIVENNFGGGYLFNLAEDATWGILAGGGDFPMRPSGLAFSLLSPMAGERYLPVILEGSRRIKVDGGRGNNPSGIEYDSLSVIASHGGDSVQVFVLNRSWSDAADLELDVNGWEAESIDAYQLTSKGINDHNEDQPDRVAIKTDTLPGATHILHFPARSVTRLVLH
ncbi:MAG: hypothetical protein R3F41_05745 [Gammaproteobacteria bacterium]|nr:hypothetical protein [Pseudomonadales bacterium]